MRRNIWWCGIVALISSVALLLVVQRDNTHVCTVGFEYSRTREFNNARSASEISRLREASLRSLRALFEDWKFGSTTGEVPLYKRVWGDFSALPTVAGVIPEDQVEEFLRATRFEVSGNCTNPALVAGRIIVTTGDYDVAGELAGVYVGQVRKFIEEENENWAWKATMDKRIAVQKLEQKLAEQRKRLSLGTFDSLEQADLRSAIASNELAVCKAKADCDAATRKYRETWDSLIIFHSNGCEKARRGLPPEDPVCSNATAAVVRLLSKVF